MLKLQKKMKNKYLILYEDCRAVEGFRNAIIYDLTRPNNSNIIPKSLIEFIDQCKKDEVEVVIEKGTDIERKVKREYLEFLLKNDFAFISDDYLKDHLGSIDFKKNIHPELIYDAILCVNEINFDSVLQMVNILDEMACHNVELRVELLNLKLLEKLISSFKYTCIQTINLRVKYVQPLTTDFLVDLLKNELRLRSVFVYQSPYKKSLSQIEFLQGNIDFINDCGEIDKSNFNINLRFFTLSQSCNTCLNKKISIDFNGEIKNCPSQKKSFGNFNKKDIKSIINTNEFKFYGNIKKDEIQVCKDCEYRHMCLDCRVFTDDPLNPYSRPFKCNYNPYIAKWKGEEGYLNIEECGVFSNEQGFLIDHDKVAEINEQLWGKE